ncbi:hypothetical protein QWY84_10755 [Aquisalimonas lutea]|uniref:hypothetical protein n=1 Tax=Aquisalimonas lutea TaxID=1327750 RepID=UPI0025B61DF1|nr:hypothetical protein [Aquisalimonas lutea]MDN3518089.1 hypothetical protein [Aquisalimonas lutea]
MVQEIAFDPVQVHSPGWVALAQRLVAQLSGLRVVVREERGGLRIRCDMSGVSPARRAMLCRTLQEYRQAARRTCQVCGVRDDAVAAPAGTRLRLCPLHRRDARRNDPVVGGEGMRPDGQGPSGSAVADLRH